MGFIEAFEDRKLMIFYVRKLSNITIPTIFDIALMLYPLLCKVCITINSSLSITLTPNILFRVILFIFINKVVHFYFALLVHFTFAFDINNMTNAETILKLNEALSTLIKAYEELQEENTGLKARINELEDEVLELESTKEDLEKNVDEFKEHTEKDKSNISSMLDKIESILNKKAPSVSTSPTSSNIVTETSKEAEEVKEEKKDDIFSVSSANYPLKKEEEAIEESNSNKIDLNRMASLLNGFNR